MSKELEAADREYRLAWKAHESALTAYRARKISYDEYIAARADFNAALAAWKVAFAADNETPGEKTDSEYWNALNTYRIHTHAAIARAKKQEKKQAGACPLCDDPAHVTSIGVSCSNRECSFYPVYLDIDMWNLFAAAQASAAIARAKGESK